MSNKVWGGITYPFLNFNGCTVEVYEWISNPTLYNGCNYLSMLGLKLNHVSKRGPCCETITAIQYDISADKSVNQKTCYKFLLIEMDSTWIFHHHIRGALQYKTLSYPCKHSHDKDMMVSQPSYLIITEIPIPGKTVFVLIQGPGLTFPTRLSALPRMVPWRCIMPRPLGECRVGLTGALSSPPR